MEAEGGAAADGRRVTTDDVSDLSSPVVYPPSSIVVIKGGGDLASGVAHRLQRAGFAVLITELEQPLVVRRTVAFASAIFDGQIEIEGVCARRVAAVDDARRTTERGIIGVMVDP
ncbi:MAG: hypothetical protein LC737_04890, partial [Chloroflexi bacterium]|nr:hypothetical protein [Chloroflexota bacterium]